MDTFFGTTGFTSAKATHYANVAKEIADMELLHLQSQGLFDKIMKHPSGDMLVSRSSAVLGDIKTTLARRPCLMQLSAWLRVAVKRKDEMLQEIEKEQLDPDSVPKPVLHKTLPTVDETWALKQLSLPELAKYLMIEAQAAAYGKLIHDRGLVAQWRKQINTYEHLEWLRDHPVQVTTPITQAQIESLFLDLQSEHRLAESQVNYFKAKIHTLMTEENIRRAQENTKIHRENDKLTQAYLTNLKVADEKLAETKNERREKISKLKIVIPHALQPIVDELAAKIEGSSSVSSDE